MVAKLNKTLACLYALGLGVGEAVINWGNWQYAPLWIVDYVIVGWLLAGAFAKSGAANILKGAWAFSLGVMYMALAFATDPANKPEVQVGLVIRSLIALLIVLSAVGVALSYLMSRAERGSRTITRSTVV